MELREDQELSWWGHPAGTLRPVVRLALVLACVATVVLPYAGSRVLWMQGGDDCGIQQSLFENGLATLAVLLVVCFAWPKFSLSRYVRLAVMLPIVHLLLVAVAWPAWLEIAPKIESVERWYYLAQEIPLSAIVIGELVVVAGAAWLIAGRRRDTAWSHAFVMISLVELLFLGLWLPIVSWATCHGSWRVENDPSYAMDHAARLTTLVIVPPLVAAIGYAFYAIRWPEKARTQRTEQIGALVMLLLVAIGLRADAPPAARVVYANFIHLLLGAQIVATAGPLLLGLGIWLRGKAIRRRLATDVGAITGVVISEDKEPVVACFEITSWLRPPRPLVRSFSVATPGGVVPIHGARLVAPLDPSTTALSVGESYAALRAGDRITISSTRSGGADDRFGPFRKTAAPIVGADPVVAPFGVPQLTFSDLALSLWRPAVAYLVILVAVAIPALAALIAPPG
ncbi:MAG TPA: hypothetical protein VF403_22360 [Kofleriaceae bacterium]